MTAIKICGVQDAAICDLLVALKVNWVGFVFYEASPRYVTPKHARSLPDYQSDGLSRIGLFVKPSLETVQRTLDQVRLDGLQLYTSEENAQLIREKTKLPVWLAKGIHSRHDLPTACPVDGWVIEAPSYTTDIIPGGNGRRFDWTLTHNWQNTCLHGSAHDHVNRHEKSGFPWMLAGGLTPDNVQQAIRQSGTRAVDVSSGVESSRGIKDPDRIRRFVEQVRQL